MKSALVVAAVSVAGCASASAERPPLHVRLGLHDELCFVVVEQGGSESVFWSDTGCAVVEREVSQPAYHATGEWWRPR